MMTRDPLVPPWSWLVAFLLSAIAGYVRATPDGWTLPNLLFGVIGYALGVALASALVAWNLPLVRGGSERAPKVLVFVAIMALIGTILGTPE